MPDFQKLTLCLIGFPKEETLGNRICRADPCPFLIPEDRKNRHCRHPDQDGLRFHHYHNPQKCLGYSLLTSAR